MFSFSDRGEDLPPLSGIAGGVRAVRHFSAWCARAPARWRHAFGVACVAWLSAVAVFPAELRVVGTDLLGVEFSKALYDYAGRHDLVLALALDGSRPGLDQLKAGRADLALLVLPPDEEDAAAAFEAATLAYHRVVVLVPPASPVAQVSLDQLAGIFGVGGPVSYSRWGELGLAGAWSGVAIAPMAPEAGVGIAAEYFRHVVLRGRDFKSNVDRFDSPVDLALRLAGESRAMALASAPPSKAGVARIVPVTMRADKPSFLPTPENLRSGDYPLRLPLRVFFRRESAAALRPLWRFLLSDELAPLLERAGVVPLPAAARQQQMLALERP
jgi:ABC-type phosphate transport system substrate-binding protein